MAFTKVQANWSNVSFANTAITRVTQVQVSQGGSLVEFAGDTDHFPTVLANLMNKPTMNIVTADEGLVMGFPSGNTGTAVAIHKDIKGQANGDITYTLVNATVESVDASGGFGAAGTATLKLRAYSADGVTNPLSFSQTRA